MAATKERPVFLFFKKIGCPPCSIFYDQIYFSTDKKQVRLTTDNELKDIVDFRIVEIGLDPVKRVVKTIESSYPDMVSKIKTVPFFWFHPPGQRDKGVECKVKRDFATIKKWLIETAKTFSESGEEVVTDYKDESTDINGDESCDVQCTKEQDKKKREECAKKCSNKKPTQKTMSGLQGIPGPSGATAFRGKK
jgi:hypothetical protein